MLLSAPWSAKICFLDKLRINLTLKIPRFSYDDVNFNNIMRWYMLSRNNLELFLFSFIRLEPFNFVYRQQKLKRNWPHGEVLDSQVFELFFGFVWIFSCQHQKQAPLQSLRHKLLHSSSVRHAEPVSGAERGRSSLWTEMAGARRNRGYA